MSKNLITWVEVRKNHTYRSADGFYLVTKTSSKKPYQRAKYICMCRTLNTYKQEYRILDAKMQFTSKKDAFATIEAYHRAILQALNEPVQPPAEEHRLLVIVENGFVNIYSSGYNDCAVVVDKDREINYPDYNTETREFMKNAGYDFSHMIEIY